MKRVRVQGDYFHGRVPEGAVYIGRKAPGLPESPYANPWTVRHAGEQALPLYERHLESHPELVERARRELAGKDLSCWCKLPADGEPDLCHGAILLRAIEARREGR